MTVISHTHSFETHNPAERPCCCSSASSRPVVPSSSGARPPPCRLISGRGGSSTCCSYHQTDCRWKPGPGVGYRLCPGHTLWRRRSRPAARHNFPSRDAHPAGDSVSRAWITKSGSALQSGGGVGGRMDEWKNMTRCRTGTELPQNRMTHEIDTCCKLTCGSFWSAHAA